MTSIGEYLHRFQHLRSDRNANWPETTKGRSPYKPLLLLAVLDLFEQGEHLDNLIRLTPDLGDLFHAYCQAVMPDDWKCNLAMPFYHLRSEGFWHLEPLPGQESIVASGRRLTSIGLLVDHVAGAKLDPELFDLLRVQSNRTEFRLALIQTYFTQDVWDRLLQTSAVNHLAFQYSQQLLLEEEASTVTKEAAAEGAAYMPAVRDQGFRRALVSAYDHRCALCGIRMVTLDGHNAVEAAHIVPWSESHDDDPRNGLCLCKLCHWTFDEGLTSVTDDYEILTSPQLARTPNVPGHVATLADRRIGLPGDARLYPAAANLRWHRTHRFRRR